MALKKPIILGQGDFAWNKGIGDSPYVGFEDMRNIETDANTGTLRINFAPAKESGTTIKDFPHKFVIDPSDGDIYTIDQDNKTYTSTDNGDSWSSIDTPAGTNKTIGLGVEGIAYWKGYIFTSRTSGNNVLLDVYDIATPGWTNGWMTITNALLAPHASSSYTPMVHAEDDKLYIAAGNLIASVEENSGQNFAPGTGATYTQNAAALTLPEGAISTSMTELGGDLVVGTRRNNDPEWAKIYPWDKIATTFKAPVSVAENGISAMIAIDNKIWFFAGKQGKLFVTNGSRYEFVKRLPQELMGLETKAISVFPEAIVQKQKKIYFGVSTTNAASPCGVWSYGLNTGVMKFEYQISTDEVGVNDNLLVTALRVLQGDIFGLVIGWQDTQSTEQGVDRLGSGANNVRYTSFKAIAKTPFFRVSNAEDPVSIESMNVYFGKALGGSGADGARISYRKSRTDAFTTIVSITGQQHGTITQFSSKTTASVAGTRHGTLIEDVVSIQFQIELNRAGASTTPELLTVEFQ